MKRGSNCLKGTAVHVLGLDTSLEADFGEPNIFEISQMAYYVQGVIASLLYRVDRLEDDEVPADDQIAPFASRFQVKPLMINWDAAQKKIEMATYTDSGAAMVMTKWVVPYKGDGRLLHVYVDYCAELNLDVRNTHFVIHADAYAEQFNGQTWTIDQWKDEFQDMLEPQAEEIAKLNAAIPDIVRKAVAKRKAGIKNVPHYAL